MVTQPTPYAMPSWAKYGFIVRRPFCPPSIRSSFFNGLRSWRFNLIMKDMVLKTESDQLVELVQHNLV